MTKKGVTRDGSCQFTKVSFGAGHGQIVGDAHFEWSLGKQAFDCCAKAWTSKRGRRKLDVNAWKMPRGRYRMGVTAWALPRGRCRVAARALPRALPRALTRALPRR